jgi:Short C-terminal domain
MFRARRVMRRRAVARTAVVGGAAYYAAKRGAEAGRQEQDEANQTYDEAPAAETGADPIEQIKELQELREQGILTEEEFAAEKKKLLGI